MKTRFIIFGLIVLLFSAFSYILRHLFGYEIMDSRFVLLGYIVLSISFLPLLRKKQYRQKTIIVFLSSITLYTIIAALVHINHPIIYFKNLKITSDSKPYEWQKAKLSDFNIDSAKFKNVLSQMNQVLSIRSILVVKEGKLIAEKYFEGAQPDYAMNIKSATKSITSTLVGIAIQEGYIDSVGQKVIDFFPEYKNKVRDPKKLDLTIKDILTMRSGYASRLPYKKDFTIENVLINIPMVDEPGIKFSYHAPTSQLISGIIERTSNMSFDDFAKKYLFEPLGISCSYWQKLPDRVAQADCESFFTPRDLARIGYLYENGGIIDGKRIVDSTFMEEATTDQISSKEELWQFDDCIKNDGYGYWWWTINSNGYKEFAARGAGGQLIHVIPDLDLVIVMLRKHYIPKLLQPEQEKSYLICELISCIKE